MAQWVVPAPRKQMPNAYVCMSCTFMCTCVARAVLTHYTNSQCIFLHTCVHVHVGMSTVAGSVSPVTMAHVSTPRTCTMSYYMCMCIHQQVRASVSNTEGRGFESHLRQLILAASGEVVLCCVVFYCFAFLLCCVVLPCVSH